MHNELIGVKSSRDAGLVFQVADVIESKHHEELMLNTLVAFGHTGDMLSLVCNCTVFFTSLTHLVENDFEWQQCPQQSPGNEGMVVTSHSIPALKAATILLSLVWKSFIGLKFESSVGVF